MKKILAIVDIFLISFIIYIHVLGLLIYQGYGESGSSEMKENNS
jgi:hypothetical protein